MYVVSTYLLNLLLTEMIAASGTVIGALHGAFLGLAQFPSTTLNPSQGLSALTEADYNGYARQALTWSGPYTDASGQKAVQSNALYFAPTDALKPNQITMMFVASAVTAGNLLYSEVLPGGPIFLNDATNAFGISSVFQLPNGANYGDSVIIH